MSNETTKIVMQDLNVQTLLKRLTDDGLLAREKAEALTHALVDISESVHQVYNVLVPKLTGSSNLIFDERKDILMDIQEEFRHVEYHLNDAKLADL